jgi:hypothetical protein
VTPGLRQFAAVAALGLAALAGCETSVSAPRETAVTPAERPSGLVRPAAPAPAGPAEATPAPESRALAAYYARVQRDLLVRGLLRTDGGGPDTVFTDTMLARNFERIALMEEYERGAGLRRASDAPGAIKKWLKPVRLAVEFGPGVPQAQRADDAARIARYARRLARVTDHPISMSDAADANFHVLFMSEEDRALIAPRIAALVPDVNPSSLTLFDDLPREIHCLVIAFSDTPGGYDYGEAIAVIRSEHPDLLRRSCIHEEVAQGLGLGNDDPRARPSIFNDDDEFALLTTHDELLLKILYDPRLRPGMTAREAMPVVRRLAAALVGGPS